MAADTEDSNPPGMKEAPPKFEHARADQKPQKNADDIVDLRVELAKSATKEFVIGSFLIALVAQFGAFFVIADLKIDPIKNDLSELKSEMKLLASNTTALLSENKEIATGFSKLSTDVEKAGRVVDDFTSVWLAQPGDIKSSASALTSSFDFYFKNLSSFEQKVVLDRLTENAEIEK